MFGVCYARIRKSAAIGCVGRTLELRMVGANEFEHLLARLGLRSAAMQAKTTNSQYQTQIHTRSIWVWAEK